MRNVVREFFGQPKNRLLYFHEHRDDARQAVAEDAAEGKRHRVPVKRQRVPFANETVTGIQGKHNDAFEVLNL